MRRAQSVQDLIDLLHIDIIGSEIESKHSMIREAYRVPKYVADDYDDFKAIVLHYYQYHHAAWLNVDFGMPPDMAHGRVLEILNNMSRPDTRLSRVRGYLDQEGGGYVKAIKNALRGRDRGLVGVIDDIAEAMKQEAVKQYVTAVFLDGMDPLDFETRVAFMEEYIRRYGNVVLPGEDLMSPYELAAHLEVVIENHVKLVNQFRNTLQ